MLPGAFLPVGAVISLLSGLNIYLPLHWWLMPWGKVVYRYRPVGRMMVKRSLDSVWMVTWWFPELRSIAPKRVSSDSSLLSICAEPSSGFPIVDKLGFTLFRSKTSLNFTSSPSFVGFCTKRTPLCWVEHWFKTP